MMPLYFFIWGFISKNFEKSWGVVARNKTSDAMGFGNISIAVMPPLMIDARRTASGSIANIELSGLARRNPSAMALPI